MFQFQMFCKQTSVNDDESNNQVYQIFSAYNCNTNGHFALPRPILTRLVLPTICIV